MANDLDGTALAGSGPRVEPAASPAVAEVVIPILRGWLHLLCFFVSLPAGGWIVASAGSARARWAATVYAIGLAALFGVSAVYHRRQWSLIARSRMKRLDHATIFVMIAGSYTPLCVIGLGGSVGRSYLVAAWAGAATGVVFAATGVAEKAVIGLAAYIALGWVMVFALPELSRRLSAVELSLIVVGGVLYTLGGIVLGTHWPDPFPAVFGYHEVWHLMVAVAATCHYVAILGVVRGAVA